VHATTVTRPVGLAAVAAGRLTQAQATALKQRIQQSNGVPFFGHRFGGGGFGGRGAVAAQYLRISRATLRTDLQSGKSLAQIASSTSGKPVGGLKAAILAAAKIRLDRTSRSRTTQRVRLARRSASIGPRRGSMWRSSGWVSKSSSSMAVVTGDQCQR
jgi:hypothetical protein